MQIELEIKKNVSQNAEIYFTKSKKIKKKIPGIKNFIEKTKIEIENLEKTFTRKENLETQKNVIKILEKKIGMKIFDGLKHNLANFLFLVLTLKQMNLIKKHMGKDDLVFHTESPGSPFGILKDGKKINDEKQNKEVAQVLGCFSKDWKSGFGTCDVFYVLPEQVSKRQTRVNMCHGVLL